MAANQILYGFVGMEQLFAQRVSEAGIQTINEAIDASLAEWNRQVNELMATFVTPVTDIQLRYTAPGSHTLQPLDEWGIPKPVRKAGAYTIGFPLSGGGTAWGGNRVTAALMTVQEANDHTADAFRADHDWMRRHLIAVLIDKGGFTFDDPEKGDINVVGLADGDAQLYIRSTGLATTDNHFFGQAADIGDAANPYITLRDALTHHPGNGGVIVCHIASNLVADTEALADFTEAEVDGDVQLGPGSTESRLANPGTQFLAFGDRVLGKVSRVWVVEWSALPDDIIIAHATGADDVVGMRQYPVAELQGLIREDHSPDGARFENRFIRYAGFGIRNRVGAAVMLIGNSTYSTPTGYNRPLAV